MSEQYRHEWCGCGFDAELHCHLHGPHTMTPVYANMLERSHMRVEALREQEEALLAENAALREALEWEVDAPAFGKTWDESEAHARNILADPSPAVTYLLACQASIDADIALKEHDEEGGRILRTSQKLDATWWEQWQGRRNELHEVLIDRFTKARAAKATTGGTE